MIQRIESLLSQGFGYAQLFDPKTKTEDGPRKVQLKPFLKGGESWVQLTWVYPKKVLHENLPAGEVPQRLAELLTHQFSQGLIRGSLHDYHLTSLGRLKIRTAPPSAPAPGAVRSHDRQKTLLLREGDPIPFLVRLGVMTPQGQVKKDRYDKFRQLNKYLELIQTTLDRLPRDRTVRIVDFGCGKAYLTFALYHELVERRGMRAEIVGLDLKEDVIDYCSQVARDLGFTGLRFCKGDIRGYEETETADLVVTLHACDTATDDAIVKALQWKAAGLLLVPCCQHELNKKLSCPSLRPVLKHGILRERFAAIVTDAVRGQLLQACGYKVKIMEFIDLEHTPKNLMLEALRGGGDPRSAWEEYRQLRETLGFTSYLEQELRDKGLLTERVTGEG